MKFHLSTASGNWITGSGPGWLRIGVQEYRENLVLTAQAIVTGWAPQGFDGLTEADFAALLSSNPAVVLLGTGATQRFPQPALARRLIESGVGFEVMDTAAACRTYNILAGEGRAVAAGLLV